MDESTIPHREIGADEEELLDRMWAGLPLGGDPSDGMNPGLWDLQRRIRRKTRRRRLRRTALAGSAAAILLGAVLLLGRPAAPPADSFAQLERMGVSIDRGEVVMTSDDGMCLRLDSTATLERTNERQVALRTQSGDRVALQDERMLRIEVPHGRQFRLTLSDGTGVWLNAGSTLEYPAAWEHRGERRVRLSGEAYFEVARDTCRPFCVEIGDGECIRVLGTSFNVSAYTARHVTTLLTGRIGYTAPGDAGERVLRPEEQLDLDCTTGEARIRRVDASAFASWKEGWLWFEAEKLTDLTDRLSRIYGIRVVVADRLREYTFSGRIRQERGIEYILGLLNETTDIVCKVDAEGVMRLE